MRVYLCVFCKSLTLGKTRQKSLIIKYKDHNTPYFKWWTTSKRETEMPISSQQILLSILNNSKNKGEIYPIKMRAVSEGVSSWLLKGGVTLRGFGTGSGGVGTAQGVMTLIPNVLSMKTAFQKEGMSSSESYYTPIVLGLSQLKYTVLGVSPIVGVGSWTGAVDKAIEGLLYSEIDTAMVKNGVKGNYVGEITALSSGICGLFSTGTVKGTGIIVGSGSPTATTSQLTDIKVF